MCTGNSRYNRPNHNCGCGGGCGGGAIQGRNLQGFDIISIITGLFGGGTTSGTTTGTGGSSGGLWDDITCAFASGSYDDCIKAHQAVAPPVTQPKDYTGTIITLAVVGVGGVLLYKLL